MRLTLVLLFSCIVVQSAASNESPQSDPFSVFASYAPATRYELDHKPWTDFLRKAVYSTGRSNRVPARRDDNTRQSGTKLTTGSKSRYRYEGNRVLFHLFDDGAIEYVAVYRQALQDTINRIDYADLGRNEQLAFWLNLHNAVLIHEIAKAHPIPRPHKLRVREQNARLLDAKLVEVNGVPLSLNDIRYNIVFRYWRNPNVIYGFWDGTIGGPNILPFAYTGKAVEYQLENNAREFVNSMRGVDRIRGEMRVSQIYLNARPYYFQNWPSDLYNHLSQYAVGEAAEIVSGRPPKLRANKYASSTADAEGGETVRYTGNDNPAMVAAGESLGGVWANLSGAGMRGGLSGEALAFAQRSEERKGRRVGSVVILDIRTDDPDAAPERVTVEPNEEDEEAGAN